MWYCLTTARIFVTLIIILDVVLIVSLSVCILFKPPHIQVYLTYLAVHCMHGCLAE